MKKYSAIYSPIVEEGSLFNYTVTYSGTSVIMKEGSV